MSLKGSGRLPPGRLNGRSKKLAGASRPLPGGSRWASWAQSIAGRWAPGSAGKRRASLLLAPRRLSGAWVSQTVHWQPVTLAPQLNLRLTNLQRILEARPALSSLVQAANRPPLPLRLAPGMTGVEAGPAAGRERRHWRVHRLTTFQAEQFVLRLVRRGERVEVFGPAAGRPRFMSAAADRRLAGQSPVEEPAAPRGATSQPLAMQFQRPARPPEGPFQAAHGAPEGPDGFPAPIPGSAPRPDPPDTGTLDVNRLTDQVIQSIDQRLTAWRERMGRM